MDCQMDEVLATAYGLFPRHVEGVQGGWFAAAYRVDTEKGTFFLKQYDRGNPQLQPWIDRIDTYMPVLAWLVGMPELAGHLIPPIQTSSAGYKAETPSFVYVLFGWMEGETIGGKEMAPAHMRELGKIFAALHEATAKVPTRLSVSSLTPAKLALQPHLDRPDSAPAEKVCSQRPAVLAAIEELRSFERSPSFSPSGRVLTHGDPHPFNLMHNGRLILVDWEDVGFAHPEADLSLYGSHPLWEVLIEAYRRQRPSFQINAGAMRYYALRRRLEDITSYLDQLAFEEPTAAQAADAARYTLRSLEELLALMELDRTQFRFQGQGWA